MWPAAFFAPVGEWLVLNRHPYLIPENTMRNLTSASAGEGFSLPILPPASVLIVNGRGVKNNWQLYV
jgi:hypothetical protein